MPIYEYHCPKCGDFEVMQKISDKPLGACPTCKRKVNKLISSTSFQLKGSGWYVTDYARKGGSGGAEKSAKPEKADSKSESKSDGGGTSTATGASETSGPSKTGKSGKAGSEKAAAA